MTKTAKVLRHLLKGNTLTAAEIGGKFGVGRPSKAMVAAAYAAQGASLF